MSMVGKINLNNLSSYRLLKYPEIIMVLWKSNDFILYYTYVYIPVILSIALSKYYPYLCLFRYYQYCCLR